MERVNYGNMNIYGTRAPYNLYKTEWPQDVARDASPRFTLSACNRRTQLLRLEQRESEEDKKMSGWNYAVEEAIDSMVKWLPQTPRISALWIKDARSYIQPRKYDLTHWLTEGAWLFTIINASQSCWGSYRMFLLLECRTVVCWMKIEISIGVRGIQCWKVNDRFVMVLNVQSNVISLFLGYKALLLTVPQLVHASRLYTWRAKFAMLLLRPVMR